MLRTLSSRGALVALCLITASLVPAGSHGRALARASAGVATHTPACSPSTPAPTNTSGAPLAGAGMSFGFGLFHRLFAGAPKNNTFVSPLSVALALDMLYDGARGSTAAAMARTLGLGRMSRQQVDSAAATLLHSLQTGEPVPASGAPGPIPQQPTKLRVSNSVWSQDRLAFNPQFIRDLKTYFGAEARSLDFSSPTAADTINRWVSCETEGKIPRIVNGTQGLIMALVNAVYFEGAWTFPFSRSATTSQPFTTGSGAALRVRMMHQTGHFDYYRGAGFQALSLPYGSTLRFSMIAILPDRGTSLAQFAPRLTRPNWGYWMKRMNTYQYGDVAFPHVDMSYSADLTGPLAKMGMGAAFGTQANFSGVCTSFCKVSQVLHKTFLHVDEKGTTAAAATIVGLAGGGLPPGPPFHFVADHPFFLGIRDGRSGAVLFLGAVNKP